MASRDTFVTMLLKSTAVSGEPVVLRHAKKPDEIAPAEIPSPYEQEVSPETQDSPMPETAAVEHPQGTDTSAETITYEEYRQRFEAELVALEYQARQEGMKQGREEGRKQGMAECQEQIEALSALVASARAALDDGIDGTAEIGVEIVYEAVLKILGEALTDKEGVAAIIREVVRRARERSQLVIRIAPADWELLQDSQALLTDGLSAGSVQIVADERVQLGGCLIETPAGDLDGRLDVQLERLRETLLSATPVRAIKGAAA